MLFDQMKAVVLADGRNSGGTSSNGRDFVSERRPQRAGPRDARGADRRPLRAGAAAARPPCPASIPAGRAEARASGGVGPGADRLRGPDGRGRAPLAGGLRGRRGGIAVKAPSRRQRIAAQLADLKMPGALESLDEVLAGVDGGGFTAAEAIERLLAAQIALRNSRRLATAMRSSRPARAEDSGRLRVQLPALDPAGADRLAPRTRVPGAQGERRLPRPARSGNILHHLSMCLRSR